jgi:hypothetical protein
MNTLWGEFRTLDRDLHPRENQDIGRGAGGRLARRAALVVIGDRYDIEATLSRSCCSEELGGRTDLVLRQQVPDTSGLLAQLREVVRFMTVDVQICLMERRGPVE